MRLALGLGTTTRNGPLLTLGTSSWIDWRYRAVDEVLPRFLRDVHDEGGLAVAAHPYCPFIGCAWKFGYAGLDAVEVWNGPWTLDDEVALATWDGLLVAARRAGSWLPAIGNSDAHREPQVVGLPHTVVRAEGLERDAILDGVRRGRSWIAESSRVQLALTVSAAGRQATLGGRLEVDSDQTVTVSLEATGAEGALVRLISDRGQVLESALPATGTGSLTWTTEPRLSAYVRAEIRRPEPTATTATTLVAMTNPIFLGR